MDLDRVDEVTPLSLAALELAAGARAGLVAPVEEVETTFADLPGFVNAVLAVEPGAGREASAGAVATTRSAARAATLGEALERYSAIHAAFPTRPFADAAPRVAPTPFDAATMARPGFPHARPEDVPWTEVFALADHARAFAPASYVGLGSRDGPAPLPSTSSGLACGPSAPRALLTATLELLERDALAASWLASIPGRPLPLDPALVDAVRARGGRVEAWDLTQAWNPCPVIAVGGDLPLRGFRRVSFGIACRPTQAEARDKALAEWVQGVVFVGHHLVEHPDLRLASPADVREFVDHGVYYALHPDAWDRAPLRTPAPAAPARPGLAGGPTEVLPRLVAALGAAGVRLYYRDLTTPDVHALGCVVARVLSPELALLHCDERWPFLGGRALDWRWRWPDLLPAGPVPSPLPHPLG